MVEELVDRLTGAILVDREAAGWNRHVLYADSAPPEAILEAGATLPLFGGRQLVLVRGLSDAPVKAVERLRAALTWARAQPSGWPTESTTVLFVAGGADRRAAVLRLVSEAEQVEVRPPTGRAVLGWLADRARAAGLDLTPKAAQELVDLVGDDLARLATELEKGTVYAGADRRLSEDVVRALVGEVRVRQYWELTQALEEGKGPEAIRVLEQLLAAGDEPLRLLAYLGGYIRDLWRIHGGLLEGHDTRQVGRLLPRRRPDWAVERLIARASALGAPEIGAAVRRWFETERWLKSGGPSPRALLTVLVADLAR